ncbi:glycosyl transferase [Methylorubrum extorquens]|uniref:glycosyltransferase family 2 protein n=1 Tax=Methylorubrum extorquens TaxID=408 RepID=UPI0011665F87|nr:glycosyltransferase [Methylorubrum extorquens]GEL39632.1 glycosyl transferase [Methylorubrum extorquens]
MTPTGQTVCLCMIVKNEAHVIRRCLASVRPIIDRWVIVDTGSTDGTQAIIGDALRDLPGTLHQRPWQDFAHNRSEALALARAHGTFTLIIDADDALRIPPGFVLPDLAADAYILGIADDGIVYQRTQIVRSALPWRYRGVLHEFLTCGDVATTAGALPVTMVRNHDGARRRDAQTYHRDAQVLERALATETDPFLVARYTFYLAQSYRDCGQPAKALEAYLHRAELGFWVEEVYVSLLQAGRMMERLGRDPDLILATYARASAAVPGRAEAAHAASRLCRLLCRYAQGRALAEPSLGLLAPADALFVETWIYAYGLYDEFAINAYWCESNLECLDACLRALESGQVPDAERPRFLANMRFALDRLRQSP